MGNMHRLYDWRCCIRIVKTKLLVDTGCSTSTITEKTIESLDLQYVVHDVIKLRLQVNVANGEALNA